MFNPAWGFGISQPGPDDIAQGAMSFQLGAAATLLSLVALVTARRLKPSLRREVWFWGLWAAVSIFLTLNVSALAWRYLPIVPYAQFPWRYLMLAIIPLSVLPGTLVADGRWPMAGGKRQFAIRNSQVAHGETLWPAFLLSALLLLSSYPYLRVEMREPTVEQGPVSYAALMRFQRTSDEMTGVTAWVDPQKRPNWSDMADLWVKGVAVTTRVDYSRVPQNRTLAVNSEDVGSAHEQVYWFARGTGPEYYLQPLLVPGLDRLAAGWKRRPSRSEAAAGTRRRPAGAYRRPRAGRRRIHPAPLRGYAPSGRRKMDFPGDTGHGGRGGGRSGHSEAAAKNA